MKKLINKYTTSATILALTLSAGHITHADDTEIYFVSTEEANNSRSGNANVLFVFDTSGSMGSYITTRENYNPNTTYSGSGDSNYAYVYSTSYQYQYIRVHKDQNECPTMISALENASDPQYIGKAGYQSTWGWSNLCSGSSWWCGFDQGSDGDDVGCVDDDSSVSTGLTNRVYVSANYHNYLQDTSLTTTQRKTDIMKNAANNLIDNFNDLNFGLMRFNGGSGGYVIKDFTDITPAENKTELKAAINNLPASGSTPLAETLWEAKQYFSGGSPAYGNVSASDRDTSAIVGGKYKSPIEHSCQQNHIVYLTDGEPTSDNGKDSAISGLNGIGTCQHGSGTAGQPGYTCLDELSGWLYNNDQSSLIGQQNVITHTIGFAIDMDLLEATAANGHGTYYTANDPVELAGAFNSIIISIQDKESTFVAPAVTVNAYNSLQHRSDLYYALFKPANSPRWAGNIKHYTINDDGIILDANANPAIDPATGFFYSDAQSFWSPTADGDDISKGGFASTISAPTSARNMYTFTGDPGNLSGSTTNLTHASNALLDANSALTNAMLGLDAEATDERTRVISWSRGDDIEVTNDSETHNYIADFLHNRPVVVTFGATLDTDGTPTAFNDVVFAASNMGFFHALDADDGSEIFSFIPQELLPNLVSYLENSGAIGSKVYGLDAPMTIWRNESDSDTDLDISSTGEHVYAYQGMRRGGRNYYALDVSTAGSASPKPVLLWQINGGIGDFADLGQTWSAPKLGVVQWCSGSSCSERDVLFFGGGYDTVHDTATTPTTGDIGNAVFMVDAKTGELLWSAGKTGHKLNLSGMENSIPGDVSMGDISGDGLIDVVFATDIQGTIWRFDINKEHTNAGNFATGGAIAELGGTSGGNFRRFYNAPSVAYFSRRGQDPFFTVTVTSGWKAHPKDDKITDRLFVVFEESPRSAPTDNGGTVTYTSVTESDLFDATNAVADKGTNAPKGWYKTFSNSEKGLSRAVTFNDLIVATTYLPFGGTADVCSGDVGAGRIYVLDALTGEGRAKTIKKVGEIETIEYTEYVSPKHPGLPPEPAIVYTGKKRVLCVGTECIPGLLGEGDEVEKTFWREN